MKFIRFENGTYVRIDKIIGFTLSLNCEGEMTVWATIEDAEAECLNEFATKAEAQKWLDDLVIKLNAEENHVED